MDAPSGVV